MNHAAGESRFEISEYQAGIKPFEKECGPPVGPGTVRDEGVIQDLTMQCTGENRSF